MHAIKNTFFNVTVSLGNATVSRFSYNAASGNQKGVAKGIMRGYEQTGHVCSVVAAPNEKDRFESVGVAARNKPVTQYSMSGTRLGDILAEALAAR